MKLDVSPNAMDALCVKRTMTVFDWIAMTSENLTPLEVTGLDMYDGTLLSHDLGYLAEVQAAMGRQGFRI